MDSQIKNLQSIEEIDKEDVLIIQKKNGQSLNISLNQLLTFIKDNTEAGISVYHFTDAGRTFIQNCFANENLKVIMTAPTTCEDILPYCEVKATMETELTLGGVRRTILFAYDSYIYFYEYSSKLTSNQPNYNKPDYYNYTGSVVLNNVIHYVRLQFWLDGMWTCTVYPATSE